MKSLFIFFIVLTVISCKTDSTIHLFNGNNLEGWHEDVPLMDSMASQTSPFIVKNGHLFSLGEPRGHLITNESYKNYRLEVVYRFTKQPGNCGILVHASSPRTLYKMFPKSIEVQMEHQNAGDFWVIAEDITCNDMETRRGPKKTWGITEGANRRIQNLTDNSEHKVGQWNTMKMECFKDQIKVWVNDDLVNYGYNATTTSGKIAIQAEGSEV
ncbi:3-keto-disaccharide hydrolase [Yeosuana sp. AK3]